MTPNIYLAQLLASEREQEILRHVERQHRVRAASLARRTLRLVSVRRAEDDVTGDTWKAA